MTYQSEFGLRARFQGVGAGAQGGPGGNDPTTLLGLPINTTTPPVGGQTLVFSTTTGMWEPSTVAGLSTINSGYVMANKTSGTAVPTGVSVTSLIDFVFGSTQGSLLYRNAAAWVVLLPGTSGQVLSTGGPAANPSWVTTASGGSMLPMVNGDVPGPGIMTDDKGQCIGVPL